MMRQRTQMSWNGGCSSSSLRKCIELLANTERNAPATLHSGANKDSKSGPPQVMSPNVEESQTTAQPITSGSVPSDSSLLKKEPKIHAQPMKSEALTPKEESSTMDVKDESDESDTIDQGHVLCKKKHKMERMLNLVILKTP